MLGGKLANEINIVSDPNFNERRSGLFATLQQDKVGEILKIIDPPNSNLQENKYWQVKVRDVLQTIDVAQYPAVTEILTILENGVQQPEVFLSSIGVELRTQHVARVRASLGQLLQETPRENALVVTSHLKTMLEIASLTGNNLSSFDNSALYYFAPAADNKWNVYKIDDAKREIKNKPVIRLNPHPKVTEVQADVAIQSSQGEIAL
jgi:hypothetical protein